MERRNRYYARSRISERKFRQLLRYFAMDFSATDVAELTGIRRKAVTVIFLKIRQRIAEECERVSPFSGEVEVDECSFGARRVRGKRGRGTSGKTSVKATTARPPPAESRRSSNERRTLTCRARRSVGSWQRCPTNRREIPEFLSLPHSSSRLSPLPCRRD